MGPDGKPHMVSALLHELREAVTPGSSMSGSGANGKPSPINADAVDMLAKIEEGFKTDYWEMLASRWSGTLDALLLKLPADVPNAEWETYLEHVTLDWVDTITAFLWPTKPRRKLVSKVCPACGLSLHGDERAVCLTLGCWNSAGELTKIGDWDIKCEGCGAHWAGDEVAWLLRALDTPEPALDTSGLKPAKLSPVSA